MNPNKPYKRTDRVNRQILDILSNILIKDIDLSFLGFVSFTKVIVSPDLKSAKVFYSVLNPQISNNKIDIEINKKHKAFKKYMSPEIHLKNVPTLRFFNDNTQDYIKKVESLLENIDIKGTNFDS